jgi:DNA invertase Pin-like site-specific DNA recombinase
MPHPLTAALYVRVSTDKQDYALQLHDLRRYAQRMGWQTIEYAEKESSVKRRHSSGQAPGQALWTSEESVPAG